MDPAYTDGSIHHRGGLLIHEALLKTINHKNL